VISEILSTVNKFIPDKNQAEKFKAEVEKAYNDALKSAVEADRDIRLAEMQSDSWLQRSWRPIAALIVFMAIFVRFPLYHLLQLIVNYLNLDIYLPILEDLPQDFYLMATAFISIYAYGRTQEKRFRK
jgi:hypothetical protein